LILTGLRHDIKAKEESVLPEMTDIYADKFLSLVVRIIVTLISCVAAISCEKLEDCRRMIHLMKEVKP